jgi:endonuclease/exonuclease/phosphatase family metal-dependent hydrolase
MSAAALGRTRSVLRTLAATLAGVVALVAASAPPVAAVPPAHAGRQATVMTYNLYLGANLQPLFAATPATVAGLAQDVWDHVEQVDFPLRAQAIARQIDEFDPGVIGLQEVALWERGSSAAALAPVYDFQQILLDALAARGERYRTVSTSRNFQSPPVPLAGGGVARFTDRDVIIVRDDEPASVLKVSNPRAALFTARIPLPNPVLGSLEIVRGWASVDVKVRGKSYRFVDTHLEAFSPQVRALQAVELAAILAPSPVPVVLVGDLNSVPTDVGGAYGILTGALGLADAWVAVHGAAGGDTSGQTDDLNLPESRLDHRIDYVLYQPAAIEALKADVVGEEQADRTPPLPGAPFGLWPSDHAGVVATLHVGWP